MASEPTARQAAGATGLAAILAVGYTLVAAAPLAIAALQESGGSFMAELQVALAMVGFAMLLMQFVLSGRFRWVSRGVGLDAIMQFHQLAALTATTFLLLHPILQMAPRIWRSPAAGFDIFARLFGAPVMATGVAAWLILLVVTAVALLRDRLRLPYEMWRASHAIGAAAIAGLGIDHTLKVGSYSADPSLTYWWLGLGALALASLGHVYLVTPLLLLRRPYHVLGARRVAERQWELTIEAPRGHTLNFAPGQFVWIRLGRWPWPLSDHPFSIASAPEAWPRLTFLIKEYNDFTRRIGEVSAGTRAFVDGPYGHFTLAGRPARALAFIAGGVGIAPVLSMLRQLRADRDRRPICLVYGNRSREQIAYGDELEAMTKDLDLRLCHVLSEPPPGWTGAVSAGAIIPH